MNSDSVRILVAICSCLLLTAGCVSTTPDEGPASDVLCPTGLETDVLRNGDFARGLEPGWKIQGDDCRETEIIDVEVGHYRKALRLTLAPDADAPRWDTVLMQTPSVNLQENAPLFFRAWLRSPDALQIAGIVEGPSEPFLKSVEREVTLTPNWQEYEFNGTSIATYRPGEFRCGFHIAYGTGTIEMTGVRLLTTGLQPCTGRVITIPISGVVGNSYGWLIETWGDPGTLSLANRQLHLNSVPGNTDKCAVTCRLSPWLTIHPEDVVVLHVNNVNATDCRIACAVWTQTETDYFESQMSDPIKLGHNELRFQMSAQDFKCEHNDWKHNASLPEPVVTRAFTFLLYTPEQNACEIVVENLQITAGVRVGQNR